MVPALVLACDSAGGTDGICRYKRVHPQAGSNIQYEFSCTRNQIQNLTWMLLNSSNKERAADPEPRMPISLSDTDFLPRESKPNRIRTFLCGFTLKYELAICRPRMKVPASNILLLLVNKIQLEVQNFLCDLKIALKIRFCIRPGSESKFKMVPYPYMNQNITTNFLFLNH